MLFKYVSMLYAVVNPLLALVVLSKYKRNPLSRFYAFSVVSLVVLGVIGYLLDQRMGVLSHAVLQPISVFLTSLTPFFFLHFAMMLIGRSDILNSKRMIIAVYATGLFTYTLVLLGLIPNPISVESGVSASGYVFYVTWMSVYFVMGVTLLNTIAAGFEDRKPKSGILLVGISLLLLLLPGPFTESTIFVALHQSVEAYFVTSTLALTFAIYLIFRYKVAVNTPYETLKTVLKVMNDVLIKTDETLRIQFIRGAVEDQLGYAEKELIGKSFQELVEERGLLEAYLDYAFHGKATESYFDTDVPCKDGRKAAMAFSLTPIVEQEEITGFVAVGRNITARREAEKALRQARDELEKRVQARTTELRRANEALLAESAERKRGEEALTNQQSYFRQLFESSPTGIALLDDRDIILNTNIAFQRMFQFSPEEAVGRQINDLIVPENRRDEASGFTFACMEGNVIQKDSTRMRKDGSLMDVSITGYPIVIEDKVVGVYGLYTDITDRKELEERLRESQKLESIGTLAGGIAHDFNNILAIILGYATRIEGARNDAARLSETVSAIMKATERGAAVVRQLLTFARSSNSMFEPVAVNEYVMEFIRLLGGTFEKSITVLTEMQDHLPPILADPTQLHQVLQNICLNARDAMPLGGTLTLRTKLVHGEELRSRFPKADYTQYVAIEIVDTGTGMDEATRKRAFEPFFTTKEIGKGTGLGLAVAFGIVQSHSGVIDVGSEPGRGTTLTVYFPAQQLVLHSPHPDHVEIKNITGGSETILFVEDEAMLCELTKADLEGKGYKVRLALDGREAVEIYRHQFHEIDLVIADLGLPGLMGDEVLRKMKEINPKVRFILASGYLEENQRTSIVELGAKDILRKPFELATMLKMIRGVLDEA